MKKYTAFFVCFITIVSAVTVFAQQGFTGPSASESDSRQSRFVQAQSVTVSQANVLPHKSRVILTGKITQSVGRDYYTFRDSTGEITVEIKRKVWRGLSVNPSDSVEITGEVEKKFIGKIKIEVKNIRKI